jgi:protein-S-isoprenylcysteine O-methyltransferase Ste14
VNTYQRLFGSGPLGLAASIGLLLLCVVAERSGIGGRVHSQRMLGLVALGVATALTLATAVWSFVSLPVRDRGTSLITRGAFRYVRHPLYAAFLTFFNPGLALYLDNWLFVAWAVALHPLWHALIAGEEALLTKQFGAEYTAYAQRTGRFVPRLFGSRAPRA